MLDEKLLLVKHQFLSLVKKNTQAVNVRLGIYENWQLAQSQTRILDNLLYDDKWKKKRKLTEDEKKLILNCCLDEDLVFIVCVDNKKIILLTSEGNNYVKTDMFNQYLRSIGL
jgi:hypothetical protein